MKVLEDFHVGYENVKQNLVGWELFREKIIFSFTPSPVPCINNDQFLS